MIKNVDMVWVVTTDYGQCYLDDEPPLGYTEAFLNWANVKAKEWFDSGNEGDMPELKAGEFRKAIMEKMKVKAKEQRKQDMKKFIVQTAGPKTDIKGDYYFVDAGNLHICKFDKDGAKNSKTDGSPAATFAAGSWYSVVERVEESFQ